jgi:hypothetical protein
MEAESCGRLSAAVVHPMHRRWTCVDARPQGGAPLHRELIADPAAQGPRLHESEVMGVARLPPAITSNLTAPARRYPDSRAAGSSGSVPAAIARGHC